MKCDAMPLVYVRILVAGLRWLPTDKSNAGILYPQACMEPVGIWWADRMNHAEKNPTRAWKASSKSRQMKKETKIAC